MKYIVTLFVILVAIFSTYMFAFKANAASLQKVGQQDSIQLVNSSR
jgi:hypothetical protein